MVSEKVDKLSQFIEFIEIRCQMLEAVSASSGSVSNSGGLRLSQNVRRESRSLTSLAARDASAVCVICHENHKVYTCIKFRGLSVEEMRSKVKELKLCFNCLGVRHTAQECKSTRFL